MWASQLAHKIQTGLQSFLAGLPVGGAYLVAMGVDKLAGLHLAVKFLGVAANVAGGHLIADDLALRIDDKGAALRQTLGVNEYLKIPGELMGSI